MHLTLNRAQKQLHRKQSDEEGDDDSGDASCQLLTLNRVHQHQAFSATDICQLSVEAQTEHHHTTSNWQQSEPATCKMQ